MKRTIIFIAVLQFCVGLTSLTAQQKKKASSEMVDSLLAQKVGRIEGKVFRSDTNEQLVNVLVGLKDTTNTIVVDTTTNQQGRYVFAKVKPGSYYIVAKEISRVNLNHAMV